MRVELYLQNRVGFGSFGVNFLRFIGQVMGLIAMKTSLLLLVYHPPVSFSSYFFLLLCEDRKRKAKGNCFCIVDVPLRILKLKSWAERIFFRLRAATLTKEYQMKVGWKTATKSPTGTRTSLCNINSHFLPTSQFKGSDTSSCIFAK